MLKPQTQLNLVSISSHFSIMHLSKPGNYYELQSNANFQKILKKNLLSAFLCNKFYLKASHLKHWSKKKKLRQRDEGKESGWRPLTLTVLGRGV